MTLSLLTILSVTPGAGWSWPILVTEEANTTVTPTELLAIDQQNRFHLVWDAYQSEARIGYNVFLVDGTVVVPDTMISRDEWSAYLRMAVSGDSLFAFWREYTTPVYYCSRSLEDGSEITPATYLFTESTTIAHIRASADSLGRLHVLRNIGYDVYYARWTPVEPAGFQEDYCWKIDGAYTTGEILVDGDRVHMVVGEYTNLTLEYLQCDLDGNITIPLFDFTPDNITNHRYPGIAVDDQHDFIVTDVVYQSGSGGYNLLLWKIDDVTGELLIDMKVVFYEPAEFEPGPWNVLVPAQDGAFFYFVCADSWSHKKVFFAAFDQEGDLICGPSIAYDHSDEDPEQLSLPDGVTDAEGNLYIIYGQGETEPVLGSYPTFGWFDHDYLTGIAEDESTEMSPGLELTASSNPFVGTVTITSQGASSPGLLMVRDITGRVIQTLGSADGASFPWDGRCGDGSEAPPGVYLVQGALGGRLASVRVVRL